ncbi:hypothetical protein MBLNU459_g2109t2 [Dothideomycetes sp. NU459]
MAIPHRRALAWLHQPASFYPGRPASLAARRYLAHDASSATATTASSFPSAPTRTPSPAPSPAGPLPGHSAVPVPGGSRPPRTPKLQDGRGGGFYLSLLAGAIVVTPVISYFYWEHRKAHMRAKKEAILHDIQARVRAKS